MKKILKIVLLVMFLFIFILLILKVTYKKPEIEEKKEEVAGEEIVINASIKMIDFQIKVYPEKRVPSTNNWDTIIDFKVNNSGNTSTYLQKSLATNNLGIVNYILAPVENIPGGNHIVYIKGISHLTKRYNNIPFVTQHENIDFTPYGDLLAGDTNPVNDNVINSLDLSTLIIRLNTGDYINDLNQDTTVNSLDLSIQIFNLYKTGDT
jgi:competence protein ComGC